MKSQPCAPAFDVVLEGKPLLRAGGRVVKPNDDLVFLQVRSVHVCPVAGGVEGKVASCSEGGKELQSAFHKLDMVRLRAWRIKGDSLKLRLLAYCGIGCLRHACIHGDD